MRGNRLASGVLCCVVSTACGEGGKVPIEKGPTPGPVNLPRAPASGSGDSAEDRDTTGSSSGGGNTLGGEALTACIEWSVADCERLRECYPSLFGQDSCSEESARQGCLDDPVDADCPPTASDYRDCQDRVESKSCNGYCMSAEDGDDFAFCGDFCFYYCNR